MRTFKASAELVNLLLKNGFSEDTVSYFPEHYELMEKTGYDPNRVKRKFSTSSRRDYIIFNFQNISFVHTYCDIASGIELEEAELRSVLAFYKLSCEERKAYLASYKEVADFGSHYRKIKARKNGQLSKLEKNILAAYEGVILN